MKLVPLVKNDKVALICPASAWHSEKNAIDAQRYLKDTYQLNVVYDENTFQNISAEKKAAIFLNHLFDDNIKAILSYRGGEGSADMIPYLHAHREKIRKLNPKWFVGFSDVTALLVYFSQYYHWPVIQGPSMMRILLKQLAPDSNCEKSLYDLLFGRAAEVRLNNLSPLNAVARNASRIEAEVIGGCLSLLNISVKDLWELDAKGKIVVIEDVGEKAHVISRSLKYLQRTGIFDGAAAIIFGDFKGVDIGKTAESIEANNRYIDDALLWFSDQCDFPVFQTTDFGHGKLNYPIIFSRPAVLDVNKGTLVCRS